MTSHFVSFFLEKYFKRLPKGVQLAIMLLQQFSKRFSHLQMNNFCHFNFAIKEEITLAGAS
jgi:hypothetical protein